MQSKELDNGETNTASELDRCFKMQLSSADNRSLIWSYYRANGVVFQGLDHRRRTKPGICNRCDMIETMAPVSDRL